MWQILVFPHLILSMLAWTSGTATAAWKRPRLLLPFPYTREGWDSCDREELSLLPCSMCDPGQASGHWLTEQAARSLPGLDGQVGGKGSLLSGKSEAWAAWRWVLVILVLSHEGTAPRSTGEFVDKTSYPFSREVIRGLGSALAPTPGIWSPETFWRCSQLLCWLTWSWAHRPQ